MPAATSLTPRACGDAAAQQEKRGLRYEDEGGWNIFRTWHAGADCMSPCDQPGYYATGDRAWFGWRKSAEAKSELEAAFPVICGVTKA